MSYHFLWFKSALNLVRLKRNDKMISFSSSRDLILRRRQERAKSLSRVTKSGTLSSFSFLPFDSPEGKQLVCILSSIFPNSSQIPPQVQTQLLPNPPPSQSLQLPKLAFDASRSNQRSVLLLPLPHHTTRAFLFNLARKTGEENERARISSVDAGKPTLIKVGSTSLVRRVFFPFVLPSPSSFVRVRERSIYVRT